MVRKNPKRKCRSDSVKDKLRKMNYGLVGETSAVQICRWTKSAIRGDRGCWKEKFYGISSAGCCQMTPSVMWCENQCLHCWRPIEMNLGTELPCVDEPIEILDGIVAERRELLTGFKGGDIDMKKFEGGLEPSLYTMSLSGEATLYPRLGEMFVEIRRRGAVSFLVTNGLNPSVIAGFSKNELPTQITVSMNAPNEKLFKIWHRSSVTDAWERFNETLDVIRELGGKVRRVVRLTLVKREGSCLGNMDGSPSKDGSPLDNGNLTEDGSSLCDGNFGNINNMSEENVLEYVDLIKKASPDFVHVKGFKSVGFARERIGYDKQPWFDAVKEYALRILNGLDGYEVGAEDERCCVVMLCKKGKSLKIDKI
ncbi:MAG: radical SAM protein [Nanoarchaeota archaeon]|nr:radical SAM protein [Nanoarchaeota archaeon]